MTANAIIGGKELKVRAKLNNITATACLWKSLFGKIVQFSELDDKQLPGIYFKAPLLL